MNRANKSLACNGNAWHFFIKTCNSKRFVYSKTIEARNADVMNQFWIAFNYN